MLLGVQLQLGIFILGILYYKNYVKESLFALKNYNNGQCHVKKLIYKNSLGWSTFRRSLFFSLLM